MTGFATAEVIISNDVGLHARPSVKFTKLAKLYPCSVEIALSSEGPWLNAKSIVKVMGAKAPKGTRILLRASGDQSGEAVAALRALVERHFDEGQGDAGPDQA
ncbi:phosphocarrier protein [Hoeflea marina]|uniref:Phosphocarrier protein HPr n=1 Tax=Hoeflea marina TaxID=274592 RepID=A0A317PCI9_9HYPH|nr:HPr family phosphocarrier protein [Hoeflea marina]PWV97137.1 phosphocarrier protein [Hoeflea marina]